MKDIFVYEINMDKNVPKISYSVNDEKFEVLKERALGKTILYTDHSDWNNEKIVAVYRSQYRIEECFRQMKDIKHLGFRPLHHWTDRTIRVHAFYCVLALMLCSLLNREIEKMGHKMTIHRMLDTLQDVQQVITVHGYVLG